MCGEVRWGGGGGGGRGGGLNNFNTKTPTVAFMSKYTQAYQS